MQDYIKKNFLPIIQKLNMGGKGKIIAPADKKELENLLMVIMYPEHCRNLMSSLEFTSYYKMYKIN
jgi:hypothetical protein